METVHAGEKVIVVKVCSDCWHRMAYQKRPKCHLSGKPVPPMRSGCQYWNKDVFNARNDSSEHDK